MQTGLPSWTSSARTNLLAGLFAARFRQLFDQQRMHLAGIGAQYFKAQVIDVEPFPFARHAARVVGYQSADGMDAVLRKSGTQSVVKLIDIGQCLDTPALAMRTVLDRHN